MPVGVINPQAAAVRQILPWAVPASSDLCVAGTTTNVSAKYAIPADGLATYIAGVLWSYSGDPAGGNLQIAGTTAGVFLNQDITHGGAGFSQFIPPLVVGSSQAVTFTLAAGGAGVTGKINIVAWKLA